MPDVLDGGGSDRDPTIPTPLPADDVSITTERDVRFRETPERDLHLDLTRPDDDVIRPLLVHVHGGAWFLGDKGYGYADRMAEAGMAVASLQYRLSVEATYPAAVRDVVAGIKWLRANADRFDLDPDRLALTGESAGGHLTALVAAGPDVAAFQPPEFHPDVPVAVDAVVPVSGIYDFTRGEFCTTPVVRQFLGGSCEEQPAVAREASPVTHVDADAPPALVYHGTADELVPLRQAHWYRDAYDAADAELELVVSEGGGHLLEDDAERFLPRQERLLASELRIEARE